MDASLDSLADELAAMLDAADNPPAWWVEAVRGAIAEAHQLELRCHRLAAVLVAGGTT